MSQTTHEHTFAGATTDITYRVWPNPHARQLIVLVHGYGEHAGRYEHVAEFLVRQGAVVGGARPRRPRPLGRRPRADSFDELIVHVYDGARHEVFDETNAHAVLATTAAFIDANTAG